MIACYHNHTTWSDGRGSIDEMIRAAVEQGIDELGLSDHLFLDPERRPRSWAMHADRFDEYMQAMSAAQETAPLPLRLGAEVDWIEGQADAIASVLDRYPLDYRIGAVHELRDGFCVDATADAWLPLSESQRNERFREYWSMITSLAESGLYDIVAHIDLPKKFDVHPTIDLAPDIDRALDAIAEADLVVELNTAGWHKPCRDGYPTPDILGACFERGIPTTINADAHDPAHLLRDFDRAVERLRSAGYRQIARFAGRERTFSDLDAVLPPAMLDASQSGT